MTISLQEEETPLEVDWSMDVQSARKIADIAPLSDVDTVAWRAETERVTARLASLTKAAQRVAGGWQSHFVSLVDTYALVNPATAGGASPEDGTESSLSGVRAMQSDVSDASKSISQMESVLNNRDALANARAQYTGYQQVTALL
jgi:hypothetical protein